MMNSSQIITLITAVLSTGILSTVVGMFQKRNLEKKVNTSDMLSLSFNNQQKMIEELQKDNQALKEDLTELKQQLAEITVKLTEIISKNGIGEAKAILAQVLAEIAKVGA